jgi:hypothetical protein
MWEASCPVDLEERRCVGPGVGTERVVIFSVGLSTENGGTFGDAPVEERSIALGPCFSYFL